MGIWSVFLVESCNSNYVLDYNIITESTNFSPHKIKCTHDYKISIQGLPWVLLIKFATPINRQIASLGLCGCDSNKAGTSHHAG